MLSLLAGLTYLVMALAGRLQVEGWATVVVLIATLGGVTIGMLAMLGEYVIRILTQTRGVGRGSRSANVLASVGEHRHAVIIGGQRCGSTLLAHLLADHPDIRLAQPERPEPKFFLRSGDHDEYHRLHFPIEAPLLLEKSTTYLERPESA